MDNGDQHHNAAQDKAFVCNICCKAFGHQKNLNAHKKRHGSAQFACRCGKQFRVKSDRTKHQLRCKFERNIGISSPTTELNTNYENRELLPKISAVHPMQEHGQNKITDGRFFEVERKIGEIANHTGNTSTGTSPSLVPKLVLCTAELPEDKALRRSQISSAVDAMSGVGGGLDQDGLGCSNADGVNDGLHSVVFPEKTTSDAASQTQLQWDRLRGYVCQQCGIGMSTIKNLDEHIISVHSQGKAYACEICGKGFGTREDRNRHTKRHGNENHACGCGKSFRVKGDLCHHKRRCNGLPKPTKQIVASENLVFSVSDAAKLDIVIELNTF